MKFEPKGLIFDCDGTLADTMPLHWHAWQIVTQRHNLHFPEDRFYSLGGVPSRDILKMLTHFEEFMKEVLHQTKDTPLNPLSSSREQRTEGTCPAAPLCAERVAKARRVGGVPKNGFCVTSGNK